MRIIICILLGILGFSKTHAEQPYDKVIDSLLKCNTMTEFYKTLYPKSSYPNDLGRELDFGYKQVFDQFDYRYYNSMGSDYKTFRLYAIVKNDTIIYGKIEQLHWRIRVEKTFNFKRLDNSISQFVKDYNNFYKTTLNNKSLIKELMNIIYYSFCCGDGCTSIPNEAKKIIRYVKLNQQKKIDSWLVNPNPEIQAYAVWGLKQIEENGGKKTEFEKQIINHLLVKNTLIYNCSGCLKGLETPLRELLEDEFE
ncbi:MAG: hypothetical protein EAZ55_08155 [Cytophagales bacterium]|nr:MAG: hypothetical protein EAZ55_08155 [Cytophagales bacterium]